MTYFKLFFFYSEEEEVLDYHGIRGNRDGGYHHGGGGRGQTEAADFWEDFNVHDPQSIYADKFSAQEEYGSNGGNYPQNSYKPTPAVESSWGQRQVFCIASFKYHALINARQISKLMMIFFLLCSYYSP